MRVGLLEGNECLLTLNLGVTTLLSFPFLISRMLKFYLDLSTGYSPTSETISPIGTREQENEKKRICIWTYCN